jgi:Protein of unknown function (DUF402)
VEPQASVRFPAHRRPARVTRFLRRRRLCPLAVPLVRPSVWELRAHVVEDGPERTVIWVAPGTRYRRPDRRLTMAEIAANEWTPVERPWTGNGSLMISRPREPYSVWLFWNEAGEHESWYVNLELPWRRTESGFDSRDHQLDIVILRDRSWQWKDEDELCDAVEAGLLTAREADQIRADGSASSRSSTDCFRRDSRGGTRRPTPTRRSSGAGRSARTSA